MARMTAMVKLSWPGFPLMGLLYVNIDLIYIFYVIGKEMRRSHEAELQAACRQATFLQSSRLVRGKGRLKEVLVKLVTAE